MNGEYGQCVGDAILSGLRKCVAVSGHERKNAENGTGVVELRAWKDVNATLVEEEFSTCDRGAAPPELAIEADRSREMLHKERGPSIDDSGVPVVGPHPVGRICGAAGFKADGKSGSLVL